jgi:hypothetical protein
MLKIAQILSGVLAVALLAFGSIYLFTPENAASARGFEPIGDYGLTNVRLMAASFITLGIMTAIGAMKRNFLFLAPAALFFLVSIVIRIIGIAVDGADATTVRVMVPAVILFVVAEFAVQVFKRSAADSHRRSVET